MNTRLSEPIATELPPVNQSGAELPGTTVLEPSSKFKVKLNVEAPVPEESNRLMPRNLAGFASVSVPEPLPDNWSELLAPANGCN